MTVHEATIAKIQQMPEPMVQEVQHFVDYLLTHGNPANFEEWKYSAETHELAEAGMSDYLSNLEDYEEKLARGEIKWL